MVMTMVVMRVMVMVMVGRMRREMLNYITAHVFLFMASLVMLRSRQPTQ